MKGLKLITLAVVATTATLVNAGVSESLKPSSVSAEIGTLGYGAKLAWDVNEKTELQVGLNGGDVTDMIPCDCVKEDSIDDVKFKSHSDLTNPYIGVQVRPMNNALTVGAGVMHVANDRAHAISKRTVVEKDFVAGDANNRYTAESGAQIDAKVRFKNKLAPYVTVGVHPKSKKPISVFGEVGAAYVGGIKTDVTVKGKFAQNGQEFTSQDSDKVAQIESDLRQEFKERVNRKLDNNNDFYPIVKVGVTARF
ncbi:MAG: hypothetical protein KGV50_06735 [Gammaproteobacteria bacterium]|nr:hypothetical protein [Gammaproteobacteria bacterium]